MHGADSDFFYKREYNFWFSGNDLSQRLMKTTSVFNNCTLCLIKPLILREGLAGQVIDAILEAGFEISAIDLFTLSRQVIEEFYDVYKSVLPEYVPIIKDMSNGLLLALEICQ